MTTMASWLDAQPKEKIDAALERFRMSSGYHRYMDYYGDERFALFMTLVDRRLTRILGLGSMDLADFNSWDCYESGMSPAEAAEECLYAQDGIEFVFGDE